MKANPDLRILKLVELSSEGKQHRKKFLEHGNFGDLIDCSFDKARFVIDPLYYLKSAPDVFHSDVYDNQDEEWKSAHKYEIPKTYSFLPVPKDKCMELDYFVRTCFLVNNDIIWATKEITKENFAKINSNTNKLNIGRYTVAPWLPKLKDIARELPNGFVELSDVDFTYY